MKNISVSSKTLPCLLTVGLLIGTSLPAIAQSQDSQSSQPAISSKGMVVAQRQPRPRNIRRSPLKFKVPNVTGSRNLQAGAARGGCGSSQDSTLKALQPTTQIGLTVSASPKLFVYLSSTTATQAEFVLKDAANEDEIVYETTLSLPNKSGIVSFSLPEKAQQPLLTVGKNYHWSFAVVCNPTDRSADMVIGGEIKRVEAPSSLVQSLKKALPTERPVLYANEGLWFDTLKSLADLRTANPNNLDLAADWQALLESAELKAISQAPVVELETSNRPPL